MAVDTQAINDVIDTISKIVNHQGGNANEEAN
jgi:hypothetical protein